MYDFFIIVLYDFFRVSPVSCSGFEPRFVHRFARCVECFFSENADLGAGSAEVSLAGTGPAAGESTEMRLSSSS